MYCCCVLTMLWDYNSVSCAEREINQMLMLSLPICVCGELWNIVVGFNNNISLLGLWVSDKNKQWRGTD